MSEGTLSLGSPHLRLTEDYVFASRSSAAMVNLGHTSNGRVERKTDHGKTLKELQAEGSDSE